ncbi:MAG TPA: hypothetical protein VI027_03905 [Rubrobacteraceae bacterium]|jgi:hypothetical protein
MAAAGLLYIGGAVRNAVMLFGKAGPRSVGIKTQGSTFKRDLGVLFFAQMPVSELSMNICVAGSKTLLEVARAAAPFLSSDQF